MIRVGLIGTSWWAEKMYLPALTNHPQTTVTAIAGRNPETTQAVANKWNIPIASTNWREIVNKDTIDALVVATPNDTHYEMSMAALDAGLHVLCDKPLAFNADQADEMATKAAQAGVKTMVPFTYLHLPTTRAVIQLMEQNYIGQPHHLNIRYYAGYGLDAEPGWRWNTAIAGGAGIMGDLGTHWFSLALRFFGDITAVNGYRSTSVLREGIPAEHRADDSATINVRFANGAYGVLHVSSVAYEPGEYGQTHTMELFGADGVIRHSIGETQSIQVAKVGDAAYTEYRVPDDTQGHASRDKTVDTYNDVFHNEDNMTRDWLNAIIEDRPITAPGADFAFGATVQRLLQAAIESSDNNSCWVDV